MNNERYENMELTYEQMENISGGYQTPEQFISKTKEENYGRPL